MTGIENALLDVEKGALAIERARLTAAEDLLDLVNEELAAMQNTVNRM
jgi:hypothetical protein